MFTTRPHSTEPIALTVAVFALAAAAASFSQTVPTAINSPRPIQGLRAVGISRACTQSAAIVDEWGTEEVKSGDKVTRRLVATKVRAQPRCEARLDQSEWKPGTDALYRVETDAGGTSIPIWIHTPNPEPPPSPSPSPSMSPSPSPSPSPAPTASPKAPERPKH